MIALAKYPKLQIISYGKIYGIERKDANNKSGINTPNFAQTKYS